MASKKIQVQTADVKATPTTSADPRDQLFAEELCERLNNLVNYWNDDVQRDLRALVEMRVHASSGTAEHPTIQVTVDNKLGLLGLLNGLIGRDGVPERNPRLVMQIDGDGTYKFVVQEAQEES